MRVAGRKAVHASPDNGPFVRRALPPALVQQANEIRTRMLKTLEYHLERDAEAMAQLTQLRAGTGHLDLASDLSGAAEMYRKHRAAIEDDRRNYRATDEQDATGLSEQILRLLGAAATPDQVLWRGYQARAGKLLFLHYEEAIRVGRFLFHDDDPEGRFPSLYSATRSAPAPRAAKKTTESGATGEAPPVVQ